MKLDKKTASQMTVADLHAMHMHVSRKLAQFMVDNHTYKEHGESLAAFNKRITAREKKMQPYTLKLATLQLELDNRESKLFTK